MPAAIALPAAFVLVGALRPLFAIAHHFEPIRRDTKRLQVFHGGASTSFAEGQVVPVGPAIVAMPFHFDDGSVVAELEPVSILRQRLARIVPQIRLVVVEIDVTEVALQLCDRRPLKKLRVRRSRWWRRRWRWRWRGRRRWWRAKNGRASA